MAADGELYVEILPSTKGIKKQVEGDLSGAFTSAEKKGSSMFSSLRKGVGNLAKGIGVALGAVLAVAIKGGIDRQLKIEDAQAKLRGLGNDAETVQAIMTNALDAVKGTAFGLEEAATIAASAVAAGIEPGEELTKYLQLTADAATIAGSDISEMGAIINKVTTRGKADTESLNQLAERGIPIFQWLAEEYGVTQQELSKMVEQGKVDAETYRKVIEDNIGGAALASGDTTRGAFKNMVAALSRFGVALTSPAFGLFKTLFGEITVVIDYFTSALSGATGEVSEGLGAKIAEFLTGSGERFISFLQDNGSWMSELGGSVLEVVQALSPLRLVFDALVEAGPALIAPMQTLAKTLGGVLTQVLPTVVDLIVLFATTLAEVAADVLPQILPAISSLVTALAGSLTPVISTLVPVITQIVEIFAGAFAQILPIIADLLVSLVPTLLILLDAFLDLASAVLPLVVEVIGAILPIIISLAEMLGPLLSQILAALVPIILQVVEAFLAILDAVMPLLEPIFALLAVVIELLDPLLELAVDILTPLIQIFAGLVLVVVDVVTWLVDFLMPAITWIIDLIVILIDWIAAVIDWFANLGDNVAAIADWIGDAWSAMVDWLVDAWDSFTGALSSGLDSIGQWFSDVWGSISDTVTDVVEWLEDSFLTAKDNVLGFFEDLGTGIRNAFKAAFNAVAGFWNNSVGSLSWTAPDWVPIIGGNNISVPNIPLLDAGGIVTSPTLAMIGERRPEAVIPLEEFDDVVGSRGDVVFQNYAPVGQTQAQALAEFTTIARATWLR